ncbi:hypothetical protein NMG29_36665 [Streptomyces cocklensis]|jgi:hypothetical protein|uniref:Uncharacterized protein n=1 Tax=Actinacidiphila cocklensis TaxID=887465 RepID=A0A9W4GN33_9ACTN|nr:hypothetical protein [Actinacidiphila cocklensis]MDD1063634.1 hypothetical protein [Actinacidiphila cocklensis]WSX73012.1 hypothetical protein OH826_03610 [Streptomyces sp. NBC_00899]WSX80922.1 hypothetical protein OH826_47900 [Streptomyces sp. NBC_00899]CAG6390943.1 conserved hypothetical protein [Actinacidiphila cocklensis]
MLTPVERRRLIRSQRLSDRLLPAVVGRLVAGLDPQPPWLPRRLAPVVSADLDRDAGVGAVRIVWRPGSSRAETIDGVVERSAGKWVLTGGGGIADAGVPGPRRAVGRDGQVGVIEVLTSGGLHSRSHLPAHSGDSHGAPWVGTTELRVAAEATRLLVGDREVAVPAHGTLLLAWTSPPGGAAPRRPLILALAPDGTEISRLGPNDSIDSSTWRLLDSP